MSVFNNVRQWSKTYNEDIVRPHRFVTRFVLIRGLEAWKETLSFLATEIERHIKLSEMCSCEDTAPYLTIEMVRRLLSKYSDEKVLLYPISECLRFSVNGPQLLAQLAQLEGSRKSRLYIPLFEFEDVFHAGVDSLARYSAGELPPFWRIDGNDQVKLQVSPLKFYQNGTVMVDGFKAYLKKWEEGGASNIMLRTQLIKTCAPATGRLEVTVYRNAFHVLTRKLELSPNENWGTSSQWEWLLGQIENYDSVEKFAASRFNALNFDGAKLLIDWNKLDENTKWLAWLWGKILGRDDQLILSVMRQSKDHISLTEDLYNIVFHKELSSSELRERRELLKIIGGHVSPKSFIDGLSQIGSPTRKLACLTGLSVAEKRLALECVSSLLSEHSDSANWMTYLETVFPELSYYLQQPVYSDEFLVLYFQSFTLSRVVNKMSEKLKSLSEKAAQNRHYFQFETRLNSLEQYIEKREKIIWFDGLGLEWMGLIRGIVSEHKDIEMDFRPVRANLPSVTDTNMTDDEHALKYRSLDQMAHSYDYSFPEHFAKEIEYVSSSFRTIIAELEKGERVIITSDHGLSPASFNTETIKGLSDVKPLHWGRDAEYEPTGSGSDVSENLFISDGNRLFLAIHGRLFGGAGCHGQIHGGATLEEALVPIIRLTKTAALKTTLVIKPPEIFDSKIKLDRHGSGILKFRVFGAPRTVHVRIGMVRLEASFYGENTWAVKLNGLNAGLMEAHVEQDGAYVGSMKFEATKGIKEIDLGL